MTRTTLLLAALGAVALLSLATSAKGSNVNPPNPHRLTVNPTNGNPISTFGDAPALSEADMRALVTSVGFKGAAADKAMALARRESGWHPEAVVDTRGMAAADLLAYWGKRAMQEWSVGLWQVNVLGNPKYDVERLKDPAYAAQAAWELSRGGTNWAPWGG